jgi:hypothetical protein
LKVEELRSSLRNVERNKKPLNLSGFRLDFCDGLLDHLDYASRAGIIFLTMAQRQLAEQSNYR